MSGVRDPITVLMTRRTALADIDGLPEDIAALDRAIQTLLTAERRSNYNVEVLISNVDYKRLQMLPRCDRIVP